MEILGAVAAGSRPTAEVAAQVLRDGGNAFDAIVAAAFAAAVAEPILASPGGGGFLLARTAAKGEVLVDFFVAMPGRDGPPHDPAKMVAIPIEFGSAVQTFHVGDASVAVPGMIPGLTHVAERFGRFGLADLVAPAVRLGERGVEVDATMERVLGLVWPMMQRTDVGRRLFGPQGRPLCLGETYSAPELAAWLDDLGAGRRRGLTSADLGGGVSEGDVAEYRVIDREPLRVRYRDAIVVTNPPPSFGGSLVAHGLQLLERSVGEGGVPATAVADAVRAMVDRRDEMGPGVSKGTTHISVADSEGNEAAMTLSNGSGSAVFADGTGVQLNNMLGEEDLHPGGLGTTQPGERIGSMMAPMIVELAGGGMVAAGSGGSERIRSALLEFVVDLVDRGMAVEKAVLSARAHWDGSVLQLEAGLDDAEHAALEEWGPINVWPDRNFYFGGVHAVGFGGGRPWSAAGDPRRGGAGIVVRSE